MTTGSGQSSRADGEAGRPAPSFVAGEREMLVGWLEFHRATLLAKCEGVAPVQLADRCVPPSSLSLLGLVRHLSDVERHWFPRVIMGEAVHHRYRTDGDGDGAFNGADASNAEEAFANFATDCDRSRRILAGVSSLDRLAVREWRGSAVSVRWVLLHMVEEYARHNGHADLLRQRLDGTVGA